MIKSKNGSGVLLRNILFHSLPWILLFVLNYLFVKNYRVKYDFFFHAYTWLIYIALFYLNYYLLMPFLLFRKRFILYVVLAIVSIGTLGTVKNKIDFLRIKSEMEKDGNIYFRISKKDNEPPPLLFDRSKEPPPEFHKNPPEKDDIHRMKKKIPPPMGWPMLIRFTGLLLVFMGSTSIRFIQKWRDDDKRRNEIEKEKISNELSFLKQQINPHFLFNSLNSIYSLSMSKSPQTTGAILKLSSILRYILYETDKNLVPLIQEIEVLENYIELQKMRLTDKVKVEYSINGLPDNYKIQPLLLIPIIENAFKYGTDNQNESFIKIEIDLTDNQLEVYVHNKIVQVAPGKSIQDEGGIGIKNIKRRLDLIYPNDYTLRCEENNGIYSVYLRLKLKK